MGSEVVGVAMAEVGSRLSAERKGLRQISANRSLSIGNGAETGKRKKPRKEKKKVDKKEIKKSK